MQEKLGEKAGRHTGVIKLIRKISAFQNILYFQRCRWTVIGGGAQYWWHRYPSIDEIWSMYYLNVYYNAINFVINS